MTATMRMTIHSQCQGARVLTTLGAQTILVWLSAKKMNARRISGVMVPKPALWQRSAGMIVPNETAAPAAVAAPVLSCNLRKLSLVVEGALHWKCSTAKLLYLYSTRCAVRFMSLISRELGEARLGGRLASSGVVACWRRHKSVELL